MSEPRNDDEFVSIGLFFSGLVTLMLGACFGPWGILPGVIVTILFVMYSIQEGKK